MADDAVAFAGQTLNSKRMAPTIFGILNVTRDSFSDGGRYFSPADALVHARRLSEDGADVIDVGPASSHPDAEDVSAEEEIARLKPILSSLQKDHLAISIDSFQTETQRFAIRHNVSFLNDIQGFADASLYPDLAQASAKLVVMHSIQRTGKATRSASDPMTIVDDVVRFFDARFGALCRAGISQDRLILDPGMGFFLGRDPACSVAVLRAIGHLKERFEVPIFISVSRKSFLQNIVSRAVDAVGTATVAAEVFAVRQGADYIRTHAPAPLLDTLATLAALEPPSPLP